MTPAIYFDNIILDTVDFQAQVNHKSHRVRRLNNKASHKKTRKLVKTDKGNRPVNFKNRVTIDHLSNEISEQDRFNALNVLGHNVSVSDIQWAKKECRNVALHSPFMFADSVWSDLREDLKWLLAQTETLEQEIALITVIKEARWREVCAPNPDGRYYDYWIEIDLPTNKKCFASIEAKEYLPLCKKHDIGLIIKEYNP